MLFPADTFSHGMFKEGIYDSVQFYKKAQTYNNRNYCWFSRRISILEIYGMYIRNMPNHIITADEYTLGRNPRWSFI